ncbi:Twinfilin-1 [Oopsacas minuta]|uniref:Twinfilin n=1 Tax=Oopsacas minuta TaxID=111878 RepID=A0AAV7JCS0_9METZ|nr:Twinfilin-1 [Oopsacas minuta]
MSSLHSGLTLDDGLQNSFADARKGLLRIVVVRIEGEKLVLSFSQLPQLEWDIEYDELVIPYVSDEEPRYIFYRLDVKNSFGQYQWLFLVFSPDTATSRQKMLYSASRSIVKKEFGSDNIKVEIFGTEKKDLTLDGYRSFLESKEAPNPLTVEEQILVDMEVNETRGAGTQDRSSHIGGLSFPIQEEFWSEFKAFKSGNINFIEVSIDISREKILCTLSGNRSPTELKDTFPPKSPRYYIYRFNHSYEGASDDPIIFVYYSPGYTCSIKERMLYSSSISGFLSQIQDKGLDVLKRIELSTDDEFSEKSLLNEIHPPKMAPANNFSKPKPPHRSKHSQGVRPKVEDCINPEFGNFYN